MSVNPMFDCLQMQLPKSSPMKNGFLHPNAVNFSTSATVGSRRVSFPFSDITDDGFESINSDNMNNEVFAPSAATPTPAHALVGDLMPYLDNPSPRMHQRSASMIDDRNSKQTARIFLSISKKSHMRTLHLHLYRNGRASLVYSFERRAFNSMFQGTSCLI